MNLVPHIILTVVYVIILIAVSVRLPWENVTPNSLGDFLAGAFSPLAFYWFVVTAFLQRAELRQTREQFERQAIATETQARTQQLRENRETVESTRKDIDEAIASIPIRISKISKELNKFELKRSGLTGEDIPASELKELVQHFLCEPMKKDTVEEARIYARNLRDSMVVWNSSKSDSLGSVGLCLFGCSPENAESLRDDWKKLHSWHLTQHLKAENIDDLTFAKASESTGLEDIRYAYFQAFPEEEFHLWADKNPRINQPA